MTNELKLYDYWEYEGRTVSFREWLEDPVAVLDAAQSEDIAIDLGDRHGLVHLMQRERYIELSENTDMPDSYHDLVLCNRADVLALWSPDRLLGLLSEDSTGEVITDGDNRVTVLLSDRWYWRIEHIGPNSSRQVCTLETAPQDYLDALDAGSKEILILPDESEDNLPVPGM